MSNRFDYVKYDEVAILKQMTAKQHCMLLEKSINADLPDGRAKSLALTALEEVYMWIGKGIRDDQVQNRTAELQEERGNE